ncbi:MAG: hypothetical protein J6B22_07350 [Clostridia bacterium]|nr:hypothetical protein [Clostridia bacterium]
MFQNIKVDIIYYNTATDFEMEFNLSGCCRMRLLTDKAPDRKTLVNHLVRAVSRSRIIMITGALFGEEGLIKTCSQAINRPLEKVDSKQYSINSEDDIEILKDSIPLISADGIFGGCIIEQGPQTLILLSENKDIRKNIMQTLIHPYVKEVCADELTESKQDIAEPVVEAEINELIEVSEDVLEDEIIEEELVLEEEETADEEQPIAEVVEEQEPVVEEPKEFDYSFINQIIKEEPVIVEDEEEEEDKPLELEEIIEPVKEKKKNKSQKKVKSESKINIPIIILSCLLLLTVGVLCYALFISSESKGVPTGEYIKETFEILLG